jgi:hypothetical protein
LIAPIVLLGWSALFSLLAAHPMEIRASFVGDPGPVSGKTVVQSEDISCGKGKALPSIGRCCGSPILALISQVCEDFE